MICPTCRTEIADNALVCYRCGRATAAPGLPEKAPAPRSSQWLTVLALVVLVVAGLLLGRLQTGQVPRWLAYGIAALGAVVIAGRLLVGRRR